MCTCTIESWSMLSCRLMLPQLMRIISLIRMWVGNANTSPCSCRWHVVPGASVSGRTRPEWTSSPRWCLSMCNRDGKSGQWLSLPCRAEARVRYDIEAAKAYIFKKNRCYFQKTSIPRKSENVMLRQADILGTRHTCICTCIKRCMRV